jgi:hypothetical protein
MPGQSLQGPFYSSTDIQLVGGSIYWLVLQPASSQGSWLEATSALSGSTSWCLTLSEHESSDMHAHFSCFHLSRGASSYTLFHLRLLMQLFT